MTSLATEIHSRIEALQIALEKARIDAALLVQRTDLYYFSGTDQNAHLYVPAKGEPILMVRKSLERARQDSPLSRVVALAGLSQLPDLISSVNGALPSRLGLEFDTLPVMFLKNYEKALQGCEMLDVSPLVKRIRMVKSGYEILRIQKAAELADRMLSKVPAFLRESRTENDLAARVEYFYRTNGHPGIVPTRTFPYLSLYGQIMAGPRAAEPSSSSGPLGGRGLGPFFSAGASLSEIRRNEPVIVDYAAVHEGYVADQARIFSLGPLREKFLMAHETARRVQDTLAREARPGMRTGRLYDLAVKIADEAGFGATFMGHPEPVPFVGHGVGLELDEWPVISRGGREPLQEGMVFALEPKIVFPGEGVVGIENTFLVTETGLMRLTLYPDDISYC
jgi:Xaa-Pro aminopeptidase